MMENLVCWCEVVATRTSDMVCSFTIEKASFCWGKNKQRKLSARLAWESARAKQKKRAGKWWRILFVGVGAWQPENLTWCALSPLKRLAFVGATTENQNFLRAWCGTARAKKKKKKNARAEPISFFLKGLGVFKRKKCEREKDGKSCFLVWGRGNQNI